MRARPMFTLALLAVFPSGMAVAQDFRLYVSPDGNDAWKGRTLHPSPSADLTDGPLRTLQGARDRLRALHADDQIPPVMSIGVWVAAGDYELDAPLVLDEKDSGNNRAPTMFQASPLGSVRVLGSKRVPRFAPVTDAAILKRLSEEARGHVVQADLKALGVTNYGSPEGGGLGLIFDGEPMTLARWPNEGFTKIIEEAGGQPVDIRGVKGDAIGRWVYDGDRPKRWTDEPDAWVHGYWFWDWSDQRHKVKSIDVEKRTLEVEPPYHGYGYRKGQWYYAFNLLSEIDRPGEWYLDRAAGMLYFWPPSDPDTHEARVTVLDDLVTMTDASNVEFAGIRFEDARKQAVTITGGHHSHIKHCSLRNIGGDAIVVKGGANHAVWNNEFSKLGGGAVSLTGGDRATLTPANHEVLNNHIHDYGQWFRMYHAAISVNGVGMTVAHNHIHDAPHMAIYFNGNDFTIEYNEIHDVCLESNDAGAIYAGRDWTMRGTKIRYNFLYNITGFEDRGCVGVYLDDMFGGTEISHNLFYRVTRAAFIGGGRDVLVENNVFVDCRPAFWGDNRAQGWASDTVPTTMMDRLNAMPYKNELWSKRYPQLVNILNDDPAAPKGNLIARNVSLGGKWADYSDETGAYLKFEDNLILGDEAVPAIEDTKHPKATELVKTLDTLKRPAGFASLPIEKMEIEKQ